MHGPDTRAEALTDSDRALFARAIAFAEAAHDGQLRKGTAQPYAVHPLEVGALLAHHYPDRPALATAGFLHDTIEDTHVRRAELAEHFGAETARLVMAVTKRWYKAPWSLDTGDADVVRLKAADCVSNIRATVVDLRESRAGGLAPLQRRREGQARLLPQADPLHRRGDPGRAAGPAADRTERSSGGRTDAPARR